MSRHIPIVNGWERCEEDDDWQDFVWRHEQCRYRLALRPQAINPHTDTPWALMIEEPHTREVRAILAVGAMIHMLAKAKVFREEHTSWPPRVDRVSIESARTT